MFNRPFDDQTNIRVRLETEAKLHIQQLIKQQKLSLVWSYILDFENSKNPFFDRRFAIEKWAYLACHQVIHSSEVISTAQGFIELGIRSKDALHVACAIMANAEYFLSTDDKLLSKLKKESRIQAINPVNFIKVLDNDY